VGAATAIAGIHATRTEAPAILTILAGTSLRESGPDRDTPGSEHNALKAEIAGDAGCAHKRGTVAADP
jgi:hypothetical protein